MSYSNEEFWERYKEYQQETRARHQFYFDTCRKQLGSCVGVLDLGCGPTRHIEELFGKDRPWRYVGIDQNIPELAASGYQYVRGDYMDGRTIAGAFQLFDNGIPEDESHPPIVGLSMFSTETAIDPDDSKDLYTHLFDEYIDHMIVAGFYYANRYPQRMVSETGGLNSYQVVSVPGTELCGTNWKESFRITAHTPSEMFGDDVYEVWRVLESK